METSNGTYNPNMTLQLGDVLTISTRANPPAQYTWVPRNVISVNVDDPVVGPEMNVTVHMIGWNRYDVTATNIMGYITFMVEFYVGMQTCLHWSLIFCCY